MRKIFPRFRGSRFTAQRFTVERPDSVVRGPWFVVRGSERFFSSIFDIHYSIFDILFFFPQPQPVLSLIFFDFLSFPRSSVGTSVFSLPQSYSFSFFFFPGAFATATTRSSYISRKVGFWTSTNLPTAILPFRSSAVFSRSSSFAIYEFSL